MERFGSGWKGASARSKGMKIYPICYRHLHGLHPLGRTLPVALRPHRYAALLLRRRRPPLHWQRKEFSPQP